VVSNHEVQPTRGLRLCNRRAAGRQETWKQPVWLSKVMQYHIQPAAKTTRYHEEYRLAHVPAHLHNIAARKRRRREGGAGVCSVTVPARITMDVYAQAMTPASAKPRGKWSRC